MLARKNGKTPFATSFCWAVGLWYARSFSKIKTVSGSMKQNMEGFGFLRYNLRRLGLTMDIDPAHGLRMLDSSLGHSFEGPIWDGQISFEALAYKPDVFDAFNANVVLLDELELYKNAIPYGRLKDATKAYGNKLIMAVTTAGDDGTGFCAQRVSYCSKIARGEITGADADRIFAFIARADPDPDTDEVNYLDPANWRKGNWKIRFLTSGTLTFTKLNGWNGQLDVFLVGGGGNGGTRNWNPDSSIYQHGAGGGGGYTKTQKNIPVAVGTEYSITIGSNTGTTKAFNLSASGGANAYGNSRGWEKGGNGGSGGGATSKPGGTNGGNGIAHEYATGGTGQGTTTKEFGEENGRLYASGGNGDKTESTAPNSGNGADGRTTGDTSTSQNPGASGIVVIRNKR